MYVYVVTCGEKYCGGHVCGIHKSEKKAEERALSIPTNFKGGWEKISDGRWENGVDYVQVDKVKVQ